MDLSIVIPMIREYPQVINTVNSIQAELGGTELDYEIILIENGVIDSYTDKFLKAYEVPIRNKIIKYEFEPNQCGPAARMKGAYMAKGFYLMFMDAHTVCGKDSFKHLIDTMEKKDAGIAYGATVKTHWVPPRVRGLHYRLFGNRGPSFNTHMHGAYSRPLVETPYKCVCANLAYVMFKRYEFLAFRGYHPACRFYPHPEGYISLKYLMFGRQPWAVPKAYHFHSVYRIPEAHNDEAGEKPKWPITIKGDPYNLVGNDHLICNAMICAYTLGGEKWLEIVYDSWARRVRSKYLLKGIRDYAREQAQEEYEWVQRNKLHTLDEVLTQARLERVDGMENWFSAIGDDPLD